MLLMSVSLVSAGKLDVSDDGGASAGAIHNPKTYELCHDKDGKWNPTSKTCDSAACGCLFHQLEEFVVGLFE